ncbi:MAG: alpha/beta fold hydrolase [Pseudomonadota bacterium]
MKKFARFLLIGVVVLAIAFFLGPREPVDETLDTDFAAIAALRGAAVEDHLAKSEADIENLVDGAGKHVVWADPQTKQRTPLSVVYIHGFSATLEEVRPTPDIIAEQLGANLHYTRLTGHGRDGAAMAQATVNDWFNDVAEALAIGRAIGDETIIVATSTGGTLAAWALEQAALAQGVKGVVMVSPNFGVKAAAARILSLPWARQLIPSLVGETRSFEPSNEDHGKWWTTEYPTIALLPMQASVDRAANADFAAMKTPALFIFHPDDQVVDASITQSVADNWGTNGSGTATVHTVDEAEDRYNHVIAGRILSPSNSKPLADKAVEWIRSLK